MTAPHGSDPGGRPAFDAWIAIHRRAASIYRVTSLLLALAGGGFVFSGWSSLAGRGLALAAFGLFLVALATVPLREFLERRERIQGLEVLRDEWSELASGGDGEGASRLRALLLRLYRMEP